MFKAAQLKALRSHPQVGRCSQRLAFLLCLGLVSGGSPRASAELRRGTQAYGPGSLRARAALPDDRELQKNYERTQRRFTALRSAAAPTRGRTTLYLHTLNLNGWVMAKAAGATVPFYDERALPAAVAALADPDAHSIVVLTRRPSALELNALFRGLPEAGRSDARQRLSVIASPRRPGESLLRALRHDRPAYDALVDAVGAARDRSDDVRLSAYSVDADVARIAGLLEVPIWGATPKQRALGTKAASRHWFAEAEVPHLEGSFEPLRSTDAVVAAVSEYVAAHPRRRRIVIKHNDGASGEGIAFLNLPGLARLPAAQRPTAIEERLADRTELAFASDRGKAADDPTRETWASFGQELARVGVVVEEYLPRPRELSVQLLLHPDGGVEVESCHHQLTRHGHYLGCEQPLEPALAAQLSRIGRVVGGTLARAGVVGPVGIDVLGQRTRLPGGGTELALKACEINLRTPATRYAAQLAKGATGAKFEEGLLRTQAGSVVVYRQTDNLDRLALGRAVEALEPDRLLALLEQHGLLYDAARGQGIVPALLGALTVDEPSQRKFGAAFVATSASDAPADLRSARLQVGKLQRELRRVLNGG
ncbi:MAG: hypothetical protein IPL40_12875 [Proteobacteria bacterium]|nr:hypothetical protein [Pseudomonadota bacterium]